ncbi:MAG TPA: hypothetical protein VFM52_08285 [Rhodanobacter sp.]|nr:hypothetical protein [Rhodanobacter sp.]
MRLFLILLGIALVALGVWITLGHATYDQTDTLIQIGTARLTATHARVIPVWVGIAGIVAGVLAALIGGFRKR